MTWLIFVVIGQLCNSFAFTIDKILLREAFTRSATYAGMVGLLSTVVIVALPFVKIWPHGWIAVAALLSGTTFIFALWSFFAAMSRGEATRVVPVVGSLIPILTLVGTYLFLGERLTQRQLIGFVLLIIATVLLSAGGGKGRLKPKVILLAITAGFFFAFSSVAVKLVYNDVGFLSGFITTRIMAVTTAAALLLLDRQAGREALIVLHIIRHKPHSKEKHPGKAAALIALLGQSLGATGFLFVQWATALGSVSLVNALQALQYAFLVVIAFVLHKRAPKLLGERLTPSVLAVKIVALCITAAGLAFVV